MAKRTDKLEQILAKILKGASRFIHWYYPAIWATALSYLPLFPVSRR